MPDFTETVGAVINADDSDATGLAGVESSLALWLDASNINGQGNVGLDSGDAISTWLDLSGNGNNAGQLTSTKVPDLSSDASKQNGKHIISFTGTDEFEIPDDATLRVGEQNYGIFVVVKKTGSNTQYIFAKGRAGYNGANYRRYVASLTDSSFTHEIDEDPQWYAVNSSGTYQNEYKVIYTGK